MKRHKKRIFWTLGIVLFFAFWYSLPSKLFNPDYSTVILDKNGELLGASIAKDGQWRFPSSESESEKFSTSLKYYEDEYFQYHPGVNPISLFRAFRQNISSGEIVSGGSTLTMQVIRLSRKKNRTLLEKIWEIILAVRLELSFSKDEILSIYMQHAPFGGNVVGLDAASWRYFGRSPEELSWGEAATLAVLPNSPGLIHPGRNRRALQNKRNLLITKLMENQVIDSLTAGLAKSEPIPDEPQLLPRLAPHLLDRILSESRGNLVSTTLDLDIQKKTLEVLNRAYRDLGANEIHNAAAIVAEVRTGKIRAYVGNIPSGEQHSQDVDIIKSRRSTGSLLKPFLYAGLINEGQLMPQALVADIPLYIDGFNPSNFTGKFDGAVPANEAIFRSLNVPAVQLLREYRYEKFHTLLNELGMTSLDSDAGRYGLSLILGGAEGTLWDLTRMYRDMAYVNENGDQNIPPMQYREGTSPQDLVKYPLSKGSIWHTLEALKEVRRPNEEGSWRVFTSSKPIAWKTGTSFGHRDAWAIGVTPDFVVGVWTGNADGEGRPGLTGIQAAAPILFDIFSGLETDSWFSTPQDEMVQMEICTKSGFVASRFCPNVRNEYVFEGLKIQLACPYHKLIHLDAKEQNRVTSSCYPVSMMKDTAWFILPPAQEYYYASNHGDYYSLPPFNENCAEEDEFTSMQFIYPNQSSIIYIPRELDGERGKLVLEVAHRDKKSTIYWHLDEKFIGFTKGSHQLAIDSYPGSHTITLIDQNGEKIIRTLKFIEREMQ